jgi:hypothetical protein
LKKTLLFLGIAGVVGYFVYSKYLLAKKSVLKFKTIKFIGGKLKLVFVIQNPTDSKGIIDTIIGDVYVEGRKIASFQNFEKQTIEPRSESEINVTASPKSGIISLIFAKGWLKAKTGPQTRIVGESKIDGINVPFDNITYLSLK